MKQSKREMRIIVGRGARINNMNMLKQIQKMPKCEDRECINGFITEKRNNEIVQKICKRCEKMEKDLIASPDYEVYIENGRVMGFNLID